VTVINRDLARGDFFVCASERQRAFWLGALSHAGRVNPTMFDADRALRQLIDVVPFGAPAGSPPPPRGALRRHFPGIGQGDPVVVWGGGVYDWFDPLSPVRAVDRLRHSHPDIRLVFLGMANPNPDIKEMARAVELRTLSAELGLTDRHVFFNDRWVPYDSWGAYLADADVAVSMHLDNLETRYSFRTRVLDYLWARLPMVLTAGDSLSEIVTAHGLGVAVAPGDVEGIEAGLARLLAHRPPPEAFEPVLTRLQWAEVARPLMRWAQDPRAAPDRAQPVAHTGS
jgi:glycosyltransferase involved in cell wall biosynthesis